jgi:casein kinase 1
MPTLWASGVDGYWDYLAIDLLGPSLDNLYRNHGKTNMDLQSVCCIAMQVVSMFLCIFVHKADKTT